MRRRLVTRLDVDANLPDGRFTLPGEVAFRLYDTYGFPIDLTQDALRARSIAVDMAGFNRAMERQKAEARKSWVGSGEAATEALWFELKEAAGATEFLGYDSEQATGEIVALVKDSKQVKELKKGDTGFVVVNQTPFYGESGGQVGDRGTIAGPKGALFQVADTQRRLGSLFVHEGKLEKGTLKRGETVELEVDHARRTATRANHSATHLLHEALRQVLGPHVAQKGSLVEPGRLRFDFSHPKPMTEDEIEAVEGDTVVDPPVPAEAGAGLDGQRGRVRGENFVLVVVRLYREQFPAGHGDEPHGDAFARQVFPRLDGDVELAAGGDEDVFGSQFGGRPAAGDRDPARPGEAAASGVAGGPGLFEQRLDPIGEGGDDLFLAPHHGGQIRVDLACLDAVEGEGGFCLQEPLGRFQQRLARYAANAKAGSARRRFLLDQGHAEAELRGADRGHVAARARADHDEIERRVRHGGSSGDGDPVRRRAACVPGLPGAA